MRYTKANLIRQTEQILKKHGIEAEKIELQIHIDEEERIDISSLMLMLSYEDLQNCAGAVAELDRTFSIKTVIMEENGSDTKERENNGF